MQPVFKLAKNLKESNGENVENFKYNQWLINNLKIKLKDGTSVLKINYKSNDRNHILPILNKISKTYQDYSAYGRENYLKFEIEYAEKQLDDFKKKSKNSNKEADFFALQYGINSNSNYSSKVMNFEGNMDVVNILRNFRGANDNSSSSISPLNRLSEINQELIRRKQIFKDNDPSIKSLIKSSSHVFGPYKLLLAKPSDFILLLAAVTIESDDVIPQTFKSILWLFCIINFICFEV